MALVSGKVTNVVDHRYGSELDGDHAAGATSLTLVWTNDFNANGGTLLLGSEQITYTIPKDTTTDLPSETQVNLDTPLVSAHSSGESVWAVTEDGTPIIERWCWFKEPDAEEESWAIVPHQYVPLLALGPRDENGEQVQCVEAATDLVVFDIRARTPGVDGTLLNDESVLGPAIASDAILARHILAGEVTAEHFATLLALASKLVLASDPTNPVGQRVEGDLAGLRWYDALGALGINLPTDGSAASIAAAILASDIVVNGQASLRGSSNELIPGAALTLASVLSSPTLSPTCSIDYEQLQLTGGQSPGAIGTGLFYTTTGGAGGSTATFFATEELAISGIPYTTYLEEFNASTGAYIRTLANATNIRGAVQATVSGSRKIILLGYNEIPGGLNWFLQRFDATTLNFEKSVNIGLPNGTDSGSAFLGLVSGAPTVVTFSGGDPSAASAAELIGFDPATLAPTTLTPLSGRTYTPTSSEDRFVALVDDGTSLWVGVRSDPTYGNINHRYNKTPVSGALPYEANHDFSSAGVVGSRGLAWDGTRFWSRAAGPPRLYKHTSWDWTTESPKYWFAYTWYDGTHETLVSPRCSVDLSKYRRARVLVTVPTFPSGVTKARIYAARNATPPATTALLLQAATTYVDTDTGTAIHETDFNSGGAAPPTSNNFGSGTPAEIHASQTTGTNWSLKGDGTFQPPSFTTTQRDAISSPPAGYLIFNSTTSKLNFYDGSAWRVVTST